MVNSERLDDAGSDTEPDELTIREDLVVTKYKMSAEIVNTVLSELMAQAVEGASVRVLCEAGDVRLKEETAKVYKKETEMKKGISFPTCISANHCICHFSPLKSEPDVTLKNGDLVKIDLGAHIDGFIAVVAHTFIVGHGDDDDKVSGRKADVILAAHYASEAALRMVRPGEKNVPVTAAVQRVAGDFQCLPVEGMLSHQLKQHVIDGEKSIILNPTEAKDKKKPWMFDGEKQQTEDAAKQWGHSEKDHKMCEFDCYEVYAVDVLVSSGDGKGRERDARTSVYKKTGSQYSLKMKASKQFLSEVNNKCNTMPFALRSFEDENKARLGVKECVEHGLVEPYTVLWDKEGEFVAQFKFTVLLMPNGPLRITGPGCGKIKFDLSRFSSEYSVQDAEMKTLLASSVSRKAQKNKKKKAAKQVSDLAAGEETEQV